MASALVEAKEADEATRGSMIAGFLAAITDKAGGEAGIEAAAKLAGTVAAIGASALVDYKICDPLKAAISDKKSKARGARCPPGPKINLPAWVFCISWYADFEFRVARKASPPSS